MNSIDVIYEYDKLMCNLAADLKSSNYKMQFFMDLLGLKRGFFYKKLKEKRFTSDEMKVLSKHLYPKQYSEYEVEMIDKLLAVSIKEIEEGKGEDFELLLKETMNKYGI